MEADAPLPPPLIGVTAANDPKMPGHYIVRWDYIRSVETAGGLPVILAPSFQSDPGALLDRLDGLILSGGHDISPDMYDAHPHAATGPCSRERDELEFALVIQALQTGTPILGICRGLQVINLVLGGDLIQHLPEMVGDAIAHDDPARPRDTLAHTVTISADSQLHTLLGASRVDVNSFHHQAVGRLGQGLRISARADDGVIEALELPGPSFVLGVQWHPEALWQNESTFAGLFSALVQAAAFRAEQRG